jgi:ATP-dependent DNA helicase RecG
MLRLLQGDVGSGKTIVAVFTLLQAVGNNFQTASCTDRNISATTSSKFYFYLVI